MNIHIRKATVIDAKGVSTLIIPLTKKYVCPTCEGNVHEMLLNSMSEENVTNYLTENYSYHVAIDDHAQIIGVIGLRDFSHLYHLFVHENYQGIGLSRRLWNEAKTECLSNGNTGNFTVNSALNSESTYLSFGFKRVEGVRNREGMIDIPMLLQNAC